MSIKDIFCDIEDKATELVESNLGKSIKNLHDVSVAANNLI